MKYERLDFMLDYISRFKDWGICSRKLVYDYAIFHFPNTSFEELTIAQVIEAMKYTSNQLSNRS